jgi:hypothetical protein
MEQNSKYGIIIETDEYAGNFEREITAWSTGQVGEDDDTGIELAREVVAEIYDLFDGCVGQESDDNGTYRPCEILDDGFANSVLIHFNAKPTAQQLDVIKERAESFRDALIKFDRIYSDPAFMDNAKQPLILNVYAIEKIGRSFTSILVP